MTKPRARRYATKITKTKLSALLREEAPRLRQELLDAYYYAPLDGHFKLALAKDDSDKPTYLAQEMDCDNFAFDLVSGIRRWTGCNCIGLVSDFDGGHCYCVVVTISKNKPKRTFSEPQSDGRIEFGSRAMYTGRGRVTWP